MRLPVMTEIDGNLCSGCGLCVKICPADTISIVDGRASVTGERSIHCGQCEAVCPEGAIRVKGIYNEKLATIKTGESWLKYGDFDEGLLLQLMRSRRSCRSFSDRPVDRDVLEDLVKIGISAPSGSNCQLWTFTIISNRAAIVKLGDSVVRFFRRLNKVAEKGPARLLSKIFMKDILGFYYREYYESMKNKIEQWDTKRFDRFFYGAPAAIVIAMKPGASTPVEDALMASQNILLAAHAMGLGTCMNGLAVQAMKRDSGIKKMLGIPDDEEICAIIAVGDPKEKYVGQAGRKKVIPRYYNG
jgi:nitroreductase/Pyruvate/2-oxoacid:ferredoxin oxidoreductase delta subunit